MAGEDCSHSSAALPQTGKFLVKGKKKRKPILCSTQRHVHQSVITINLSVSYLYCSNIQNQKKRAPEIHMHRQLKQRQTETLVLLQCLQVLDTFEGRVLWFGKTSKQASILGMHQWNNLLLSVCICQTGLQRHFRFLKAPQHCMRFQLLTICAGVSRRHASSCPKFYSLLHPKERTEE